MEEVPEPNLKTFRPRSDSDDRFDYEVLIRGYLE